MSILTRINDIPLFNTSQRAMEWGKQFGLVGFHSHAFQGQTGYMAGTSHSQAMQAVSKGPQAIKQNVPRRRQIVRRTIPPTRSSNSGGGGGGY
tara:strand:- start:39 stop:317 length:279 start_codon:yes stop_codon:yes gene_type:complete